MFFSKSFGYALRGVLYLSSGAHREMVNPEIVATRLKIPRHFLAKVLKRLAKEGIIESQRGPGGGFAATTITLKTTLLQIAEITGETADISSCALGLRRCNSQNPCPIHYQVLELRNQWIELLSSTTIGDLLHKEYPDFLKSIAVI